MKTIDVAKLIGVSPISRPLVHDLFNLAKNSQEKEILLDFFGVEFASRSFMDEFYNVFLKDADMGFSVEVNGMNSDLQAILAAVKKTQSGGNSNHTPNSVFSESEVYTTNDIDDFTNFLSQCLQ